MIPGIVVNDEGVSGRQVDGRRPEGVEARPPYRQGLPLAAHHQLLQLGGVPGVVCGLLGRVKRINETDDQEKETDMQNGYYRHSSIDMNK